MTDLSIVIPAYNEADAIRSGKLERIVAWLKEGEFSSEIIVVDDGSQDETARLAEGHADLVIRNPHGGKGASIVTGIQRAEGKMILFTDMDQATPITEASLLLHALARSADIAIGSRGLARRGAPIRRYLLSWGQMALRNALLDLAIVDTQCGFKAMRRTAALDVIDHLYLYHPRRTGTLQGPSVTSGFDVEFLLVAGRLGYRIQEIPVTWDYQNTRRVSATKDAWLGIVDLGSIWLRGIQGRYPVRARGPVSPKSLLELSTR
jgi:dolichyl-phosphate beta-glucosyltransferase